MNAQFFEQPMHVSMHRGRADPERRSDFLVLHALKQAGQYLLLTRRQAAFLGELPDLMNELNQKGNDLFGQCEFPFENIINRIQELLRGDRLDQELLTSEFLQSRRHSRLA